MDEPLEQTASVSPGHETEIQIRINIVWEASCKQKEIIKIKMPLSLKSKVFNQLAIPVSTYASESRSLTKPMECKVVRTETIMMGSTLPDRYRASWIQEQTNVDIVTTYKKEKWPCTEPILRMAGDR
ncbi:uncharacterized protein [Palaemon carinicauda]|uniref:uncharacterized protein n=1 Tax=Palaemon carinicauda TaxID=392227 RepID=UPI0035B620C7